MVWRQWGNGPDIVLLHGGSGTWMHWARNIEHLARHRTVWIPDLPGFGDSDLPDGEVDADTIAPIVLTGLSQMLNSRPFELVGFSFGGLVAAMVAASNPPPLKKLILVSVAGMGLVSRPAGMRSARNAATLEERADILRHNLNVLMLRDPASVDELALYIQQSGTSLERAKGRSLARTDVLFSLAKKWQCPVFGIWAEEDALYVNQMQSLRDAVVQLGLCDTHYIKSAGHWVQYERASCFNEALDMLLERPVEVQGMGASQV